MSRLICSGCNAEVSEDEVAEVDGRLVHIVQEADHDGPGSDIRSWYMTNVTCGEVRREGQDSME